MSEIQMSLLPGDKNYLRLSERENPAGVEIPAVNTVITAVISNFVFKGKFEMQIS